MDLEFTVTPVKSPADEMNDAGTELQQLCEQLLEEFASAQTVVLPPGSDELGPEFVAVVVTVAHSALPVLGTVIAAWIRYQGARYRVTIKRRGVEGEMMEIEMDSRDLEAIERLPQTLDQRFPHIEE